MLGFCTGGREVESCGAKVCCCFALLNLVKVYSTQQSGIAVCFGPARLNFFAVFVRARHLVAAYLLPYIGAEPFAFDLPG